MIDRISDILNFLEAIEPFKTVERATYLSDLSRHESDADHTWHMAMLALLLYSELNFELDLRKALALILVHDLCEIYGGDTFAHSTQNGDRENELEGAKKLFALLPPDLHVRLLGYWLEFTDGTSPESRYAQALDRLQALAQNVFCSGRTWKEHGVNESMSRDLNREAMALDPILAEAFEQLYQRAHAEGLWTD